MFAYFNRKKSLFRNLSSALSYQYTPVGSDNTEFKYDVDKKGYVFLDKAEMRQYNVTRERQSYSLALDYKFNVSNFHATEHISAAYLRLDQRLGRNLDMTLGMRMENTYCKYRGFNWIVNDADDENGRLVATGDNSTSYTNQCASFGWTLRH